METNSIDMQIKLANQLEYAGVFDLAEETLLKVLPEIEKHRDGHSYGTIHINLGSVTNQAGKVDDAIKHYGTAVKILTPLKGESVGQCAYAHFNLATIYLDLESPKAQYHADLSFSLISGYPFSTREDVLDAEVVVILSMVYSKQRISIVKVKDVWDELVSLSFNKFNRNNMLTFAGMVMSLKKHLENTDALKTVRSWADENFYEVLKKHSDQID